MRRYRELIRRIGLDSLTVRALEVTMKKLCVLVALTLAVTSAVEAKDYPIKRPANAYGDVYFDMGPEANVRLHCWLYHKEGVEQEIRACRPEDIAEPTPRKRTAADYEQAEREIAAEKERQALEEKMRENKFERSLGEVSGEDIYYNRVTNQTMIINKKTGEVKIR